jgi:parallel beta-helix repeat protein
VVTSSADPTVQARSSVTITPDVQPPAGNSYYVSPQGRDSNDGSVSHPWATMEYADANIPAGATVIVEPGTYTWNKKIVLNSSGSASAHTVWLGRQDASAPRPQLNDTTVDLGGSYVDFRGFEITRPDTIDAGLRAVSGHDILLSDNYVHDVGTTGSACPDGGGIDTNNPAYNVIIEKNIVTRTGIPFCTLNGYPGTSNHGIYVGGHASIVRNNLVSGAAGYGITLYHDVCNNVIANNTVFNNVSGGIEVAGESGAVFCAAGDNNTSVTNNLVVHNGSSASNGHNAAGAITFSGAGSNNKAYNNLLSGNLSIGGAGADNIFVNGSSPVMSGNITNQADYTALFMNYQDDGSGDYHLAAGSAAIGAGINSTQPCATRGVPAPGGIWPCVASDDFDSIPRPASATMDIGAFEHP